MVNAVEIVLAIIRMAISGKIFTIGSMHYKAKLYSIQVSCEIIECMKALEQQLERRVLEEGACNWAMLTTYVRRPSVAWLIAVFPSFASTAVRYVATPSQAVLNTCEAIWFCIRNVSDRNGASTRPKRLMKDMKLTCLVYNMWATLVTGVCHQWNCCWLRTRRMNPYRKRAVSTLNVRIRTTYREAMS